MLFCLGDDGDVNSTFKLFSFEEFKPYLLVPPQKSLFYTSFATLQLLFFFLKHRNFFFFNQN